MRVTTRQVMQLVGGRCGAGRRPQRWAGRSVWGEGREELGQSVAAIPPPVVQWRPPGVRGLYLDQLGHRRLADARRRGERRQSDGTFPIKRLERHGGGVRLDPPRAVTCRAMRIDACSSASAMCSRLLPRSDFSTSFRQRHLHGQGERGLFLSSGDSSTTRRIPHPARRRNRVINKAAAIGYPHPQHRMP